MRHTVWTPKSAYLVDVYHPENIKKIFDQTYENKITVKNIEWIGDDIIAAGSDSSSVYIGNARNNSQYILHGHRNVSKIFDSNTENAGYLVAVVTGCNRLLWHIKRSVVNQVSYNKTFNLLASSGVEKIVKLWSKFNQELFPRSRPLDVTIERATDSTSSSSGDLQDGTEDGRSKRDIYIEQVMNAEANGEALAENSDEDEEIIAFFAALREESNAVSSRLEADANSIVGTQRMTNFYGPDDMSGSSESSSSENEYNFEIESSSSDSSGILEPLSRTENERLAELERLDIARRIHRDRQRLIQHLGGSGPSTVIVS